MKNLSFCLILILAFGCNSAKSKKDAMYSVLKDDSYTVVSLMGNDISAEKLTMEISETDQRISGFSGCNTYFGAINSPESDVLFSGIAATKKFCATSMKTEKAFLAAVQNVIAISAKGNLINLTDGNGETTIVLKK